LHAQNLGEIDVSDVTNDLAQLYVESDALSLADLIRRKQVSPIEIVDTAIFLIERLDPKLNAVVIRTFDIARQAAAHQGTGPFAGVPFLLKNIGSMWKGTPLTSGLGYLKDFVCESDSEMARRMRAAGLLVLGRTNTPEYGWSITTEPRLYGPTINPWNPALTAGGSSGGSAAAVAARIVPIAEASDGGGSIRVPASCCGVVGLKPSRGRITYGPDDVDPWFGSIYTFCHTRTVRDAAAFLDAVAGTMPGDPYNPPRPEQSWLSLLGKQRRRLRVGFTLTAPWGEPLSSEVKAAVEGAVNLFQTLGHEVEEHAFEVDLEAAWWRYNDIIAVETAGEFDRWARVVGRPVEKQDLAPFNWSMLEHSKTLSASQYAESFAAVRKAGQRIAVELAPYDVFVTPTLTQPPRPFGYWSMEDRERERYLARWSDAAFMFTFNISGLPAMSVPAAMSGQNAPIGIQLVGRYGDEATILELAREMEQAAPWIQRTPVISAGRAVT
jgi:amidase